MQPKLSYRTWRLIFQDLSLDAAYLYWPAMGLYSSNDHAFVQELQALIVQYESQFISEQGTEQFVKTVVQSTRRYGEGFPFRLRDWAISIYPNDTTLQAHLFRWQLIITRGGKDGARDVQPVPEIIHKIRRILQTFEPVIANQLQATTEWDRHYCAEKEATLGFSAFDWVESAVRNYRFLYAWDVVTKDSHSLKQMEQIYQWGLHEGQLLKMPREMIVQPEQCLQLPESLKKCA